MLCGCSCVVDIFMWSCCRYECTSCECVDVVLIADIVDVSFKVFVVVVVVAVVLVVMSVVDVGVVVVLSGLYKVPYFFKATQRRAGVNGGLHFVKKSASPLYS